jgi:hypothetical protein
MDILIPFRLMLAAILRAVFVMALVAAAITPASFSQSSSQGGEKVWYWRFGTGSVTANLER